MLVLSSRLSEMKALLTFSVRRFVGLAEENQKNNP
jgi:hypothetical protein